MKKVIWWLNIGSTQNLIAKALVTIIKQLPSINSKMWIKICNLAQQGLCANTLTVATRSYLSGESLKCKEQTSNNYII